ncbi:MAG: hypothetical protein FWF06_04290 [Symbiobacteriaceae bacterium]|nr:hypothetical protein [Symbiobacteriaceae bacterium]
MGTIGIILSFAVVALLFGRGLLEDSATIPFMICAICICALGGYHLWLLHMIPFFPCWFEAIFRLPGARRRRSPWVLLCLAPGALYAANSYFAQLPLPIWIATLQTAILCALELELHTLPVLSSRYFAGLEKLGSSIVALTAWAAVSLAQRYLLLSSEVSSIYLFTVCFAAVYLYQLWKHLASFLPLPPLGQRTMLGVLGVIFILWIVILIRPPVPWANLVNI